MLTISAEELLKLPLIRTFATIITIVLCICPGIYMFYLHDYKTFIDINIFKLLLICISINTLAYIGLFTLILILSVFEAIVILLINSLPLEGDATERLKSSIEKSILVTNTMIMFGIIGAILIAKYSKEGYTYESISTAFTGVTTGFIIGWFGPVNLIRKKEVKKPSDNLPT